MIYHDHPKDASRAEPDLYGLERTVRHTTKALRKRAYDFDSIVVTGMSGVVVGIPVGLRLKKPVVIVRKPDEDRHASARLINGRELGKRALFLDDLVSGGRTRARVKTEVERAGGQVVSQYMYHHQTYDVL